MNTEIIKTIINVPSTGDNASLPGAWTAQQMLENFRSEFTGLATMTSSVSEVQTEEGIVRTVSFAPQLGTKG